jgi:hypothetical protein
MVELQDYSGEFRPNIKYQDFSKDALSRLLTEFARLNMCLDEWWHELIKEKRGTKEAMEFEDAVWKKYIPYWETKLTKALDITGNDVSTCFRALQMDSSFCYNIFDIDWTLKDRNHGTVTIKSCPAVKHLEGSKNADILESRCQMDLECLNRVARFFNPDMEVVALKRPPRKSKDDICCKWEFRLEPKGKAGSSVQFNPKLRYQDLSKDALSKLCTEYARLGLKIDGWWQEVVRERIGDKEALEWEMEMWAGATPFWQTRTMKALNIKGNDVATCIKTLQMDPQFCFNIWDIEFEMRDPNHGTYTAKSCHAVRYFESINNLGALFHMCKLDWVAYAGTAKFINPDMEVVALQLPPRKSKDEICCKYEFRLEPQALTGK